MSQNGMLLQRYIGKPPGRAHEGVIISIRPNLRWSPNGLEIACWNAEVVRVAFALDTCDREVLAWCAGTGGISDAARNMRSSLGAALGAAIQMKSNYVEWCTQLLWASQGVLANLYRLGSSRH
jgi:putative transposase